MPEILTIQNRLGIELDTPVQEDLAVADQWYSLNSSTVVTETNNWTGNVFNGVSGKQMFGGSSQGSADKVCAISYGLFVNGALKVQTDMGSTAGGKLINFSADNYVQINNGDDVELKIKSDTTTTKYDFAGLGMTLEGFS